VGQRLVVLAAAALLAGCVGGEDDGTVATLLDGTSAERVPVELEDIDDELVLTSVSAVPVANVEGGSAAGICLRAYDAHIAEGSAVVRVGVATESVTFAEAGGRSVFGCSNSAGPREDDRRWCGLAYGTLTDGELRDPRLSILCKTEDGDPVGFVWVEPHEEARYVAAKQPGYTEVYEVAADLPVRIATVSGVDFETTSATFEVSEHAADGRRIREYELDAVVAG
jgi:hypothetical protein